MQTIKKKKLHALDCYVIFSILMLLAYTVAILFFSESEHDTLTTCFFSCFGGEILSACLIKIFKLKSDEKC